MKFKHYIRSLLLLTIAFISLTPSAQASKPQAPCPLDRATYSAIGKPDFELQFSPIENPKIATEIVAFTFQHRDRGMLATYNLGGLMGYGSYYLRDLAKPIEEDSDSSLKPVFFDANLKQYTELTKGNAPQYLFISGLGASDWYADRAGNREQPLREVMWQLSACRTEFRPNS